MGSGICFFHFHASSFSGFVYPPHVASKVPKGKLLWTCFWNDLGVNHDFFILWWKFIRYIYPMPSIKLVYSNRHLADFLWNMGNYTIHVFLKRWYVCGTCQYDVSMISDWHDYCEPSFVDFLHSQVNKSSSQRNYTVDCRPQTICQRWKRKATPLCRSWEL